MGVVLRGDWQKPAPGKPLVGTILMAYAGRGDASGDPFIDLQLSSGIMDMAIWYPDQDPNNIQPYPYTIRHKSGNNSTVEDVTLVNSYQGLWVQGPGVECNYFVHVYGTPLFCGMEIDYVSDIGRQEDIHFSPDYWADSGLPGAPSKGGAYARWMYENGTGFLLHRSDWPYDYDQSFQGYATGLKIINGPSGAAANGQFLHLNISNCRVALDCVNGGPNCITYSSLLVDQVGIWMRQTRTANLLLNSCTIAGKDRAVRGESSACTSFEHCIFNGVVEFNRGSVLATDCDFHTPGQALLLDKGTAAASIVGNRFADQPGLVNESLARFVKIDMGPVTTERPPDYQHPEFLEHKPARRDLYVVTDERWGAKADGVTDDTDAIQKALDAAGAAGGGIVYLPGGKYCLRGRLTVPTGVELRGIYDVPHHSQAVSAGRGSLVLVYDGKGEANGPATIALKAHSGLRGLDFFYPDQDATIIPYPYLIQGQGAGVYIIDPMAANAYQFIDLFSHRCDNHFVEYPSGCVLRVGVHVGGGSQNGLVQNTQFNLHYWVRSSYPNLPKGNAAWDYMHFHQDGIILGDCQNETLFDTFVIPSHRGLCLVKENGRGPTALVVGHGTDVGQYSVYAESTGATGVTLINTQLVALPPTADTAYFMLPAGSDARVRAFNTSAWGATHTAIQALGGRLYIQQADFAETGEGVVAKDAFLRIENSCFDSPCKFDVDPTQGPITLLANYFLNGITGNVLPAQVATTEAQVKPGIKVLSLVDTQVQPTPDPNATKISVTLTNPQQEDGIRLVETNGETENVPVVAAGRAGWKAVQKRPGENLRYVYFTVTQPYFRDGGHPNVSITLDYLDEGDCDAILVYDSSDPTVKVNPDAPGAWKAAGVVHFGHTGQWKQQTFLVSDALFSGRCNGADIRLNVSQGVDVILGGLSIAVSQTTTP
jgi:hypothetical protein